MHRHLWRKLNTALELARDSFQVLRTDIEVHPCIAQVSSERGDVFLSSQNRQRQANGESSSGAPLPQRNQLRSHSKIPSLQSKKKTDFSDFLPRLACGSNRSFPNLFTLFNAPRKTSSGRLVLSRFQARQSSMPSRWENESVPDAGSACRSPCGLPGVATHRARCLLSIARISPFKDPHDAYLQQRSVELHRKSPWRVHPCSCSSAAGGEAFRREARQWRAARHIWQNEYCRSTWRTALSERVSSNRNESRCPMCNLLHQEPKIFRSIRAN
jgi:hypothetical protein